MIAVAEPNISALERQYVGEAISSGWVSAGPFVERFEQAICDHTGAEWAVAVMSGTAALHVAIAASMQSFAATGTARIRSMNFVAGANALSYCGITPHFVDVTGEWTPDVSRIGEAVVDAAPAIATVKPEHGVFTCVSFNGNKTITTGQGGAIIGMSPWMEDVARRLVNVCKVPDAPDHYEHDGVGFNYRMPNINAAFGCAQMERLPEFIERKRAVLARYRDAGLELLNSEWMAIWNAGDRDSAIARLGASEVSAKPFWKPLHLQAAHGFCPRDAMPRTEAIWRRLVCLPCSTNLTDEDQDKVIEACAATL